MRLAQVGVEHGVFGHFGEACPSFAVGQGDEPPCVEVHEFRKGEGAELVLDPRQLMPVLPPQAASTMARVVVGMCATRSPRFQTAAANPTASLRAPPPQVSTKDDRVRPCA